MDNFDLKKYLAEGRINISEAVFKVTQEFEAVEDPNWNDGRDYVSVEDNGKGGEWIIDPNQKKYTPGTLQIIAVLEEQEFEWEKAEDYFSDVAAMQAFKDVDDAEDYIYDNFGTDFIDELELHRSWEDAMFPRAEQSPFMEEEDKINEDEIEIFTDDELDYIGDMMTAMYEKLGLDAGGGETDVKKAIALSDRIESFFQSLK